MYHTGAIGLTVLAIYLLTLFLSSGGFIPAPAHRRFWNWILLAAFMVSALAGLFLAVRSTYKWNIPHSEQILKWHVEFGIAMAFSAIIHLTWHLGYYFSTKKQRAIAVSDQALTAATLSSGRQAVLLLMITGIISTAVQFIMLREAMMCGGSSEASAGIFLWLWLLISASGSLAGRKASHVKAGTMMISLLAAALITPVLFVVLNRVLTNPGETPSLPVLLIIFSLPVAPLTFITAFTFIRLAAISAATSGIETGRSLAAETAGSVAAGIAASVAVSLHLSNYRFLLIAITVSSLIVFILFNTGRIKRTVAVAVASAVFALILILDPDTAVRDVLIRGVKADRSTDTPYGNITTGTYGGERTVFYNLHPFFFSGDVITTEENIHYALLQRDHYGKVLLISGGLKRHLPELLRYPVGQLVYLEPDPGIVAAGEAEDTLAGKMKVTVVTRDPIRFLRASREEFDAVIQLIPPPSDLAMNRFFTSDYFRMISGHLTTGGVFMCTPAPWFSYLPPSALKTFSPVYNSLSSVFTNVILIPGSSLYAVASSMPLNDSITVIAGRRMADLTYVNSDYLDDGEMRRKAGQALSQVDGNAGLNTAVKPISSWYASLMSLESKGLRSASLPLLAIMLIIPFFFVRKRGLLMFATSASLSGLGMVSLFFLQVTAGNIYMLSATVISFLMGSLALGAGTRIKREPGMISKIIVLSLVYLGTGVLSGRLADAPAAISVPFVFISLSAAGYLTGTLFRELTPQSGSMPAAAVYSSDLAGSALGYLTVSTVMVPLLGIMYATFVLAAVILLSGMLVTLFFKH